MSLAHIVFAFRTFNADLQGPGNTSLRLWGSYRDESTVELLQSFWLQIYGVNLLLDVCPKGAWLGWIAWRRTWEVQRCSANHCCLWVPGAPAGPPASSKENLMGRLNWLLSVHLTSEWVCEWLFLYDTPAMGWINGFNSIQFICIAPFTIQLSVGALQGQKPRAGTPR